VKFGFQILNINGCLSEPQIKEKEKALVPQEQEALLNNGDVTSVMVTKPLESLNIGSVSFL